MVGEDARFLLINGSSDPYWTQLLAQALEPLGVLHVGVEQDMVALLRYGSYDLIIIDTSGVEHTTALIKRIHAELPSVRIVLMTASPTWARAREAFLAGAIDYTGKSLDPDEIRSVVQSALNKPQPSRQPE